MPTSAVKIECSACGQHYSLELGADALSLTCQKCGAEFVAETIDDTEQTPFATTPLVPRVPTIPSHSLSQNTMRYYYVSADNLAAGPVDQGQLQELFRQGQITGETGIALEGSSDWIPFRQVQFQQQPAAPARAAFTDSSAGSSIGGQVLMQSPKKVILAGWLLIGVTCLVALIPGIGFLTWLIAAPILLVTFILGIVALNKGSTTQGIMILLASLIVAPLFLVVAPIVTTALAVGGGAAAAASTVASELEVPAIKPDDKVPEPSQPNQPPAAPAPKPAPPRSSSKGNAAQVGELVALNGLELEISKLAQRRTLGGDLIGSKASKGGIYLVVDWSYKNASRKPMGAFSQPKLTLISPDGTEYEEDLGATAVYAGEVDLDEKILSNLNPGITVQSASVIEVAENLLAEEGWRIQIEFDDDKTFFAVRGTAPKVGSSSGVNVPQTSANSEGNKENLDTMKKALRESELAANNAKAEQEKKEKLAELKGELATINAKIDSERSRFQAGVDVINRLTNFKKTPVQEGTQAYYKCVEASKIVQEVEAGAAELKAEKARLEATITELEK